MEHFVWGTVVTVIIALIGLIWRDMETKVKGIKADLDKIADTVNGHTSDIKLLEQANNHQKQSNEQIINLINNRFNEIKDLIETKIELAMNKKYNKIE